MTPKEKLTIWVAVIGLVIIALVFWSAKASAEVPTSVTFSPLTPIATGETPILTSVNNPASVTDAVTLCNAAPLHSFAAPCQGITWDFIGLERVDFRADLSTVN